MNTEGDKEAQLQVDRFVADLLDAASRIASRRDAEAASAAHVRMAAEQIYTDGASRTGQIVTVLGSIVAGAAASALVAFLMATKIDGADAGAAAALTVAGTVAAVLGFGRR